MTFRKAAAPLLVAAWAALALAACAESATSPRATDSRRAELLDPIDYDTIGGGGGPPASTMCELIVKRKYSETVVNGGDVTAGQTYVFAADWCNAYNWESSNELITVTPIDSRRAEVKIIGYDVQRDTGTISYYNSGFFIRRKVKIHPVTLTLTGNGNVTVNGVVTLTLAAIDDAGETLLTSSWPQQPVMGTSNTSVATVTQSAGNVYVSGRAQGSAAITASLLGGTTSKIVNVVPASGVAVTVSPSIYRATAPGKSVQFSATAVDAAGNPVTGTKTWTSDNLAVATVNSNGLVTLVGYGTAHITASVGGGSGSGSVSVNNWCYDCP